MEAVIMVIIYLIGIPIFGGYYCGSDQILNRHEKDFGWIMLWPLVVVANTIILAWKLVEFGIRLLFDLGLWIHKKTHPKKEQHGSH